MAICTVHSSAGGGGSELTMESPSRLSSHASTGSRGGLKGTSVAGSPGESRRESLLLEGGAVPHDSPLSGDLIAVAMSLKWLCVTSDGYRERIGGYPDHAASAKGYIVKVHGSGHEAKVDVFWNNGRLIGGYSAAEGREDLLVSPVQSAASEMRDRPSPVKPVRAGSSASMSFDSVGLGLQQRTKSFPEAVEGINIEAAVGYLYTAPVIHKKATDIALWDDSTLGVSMFAEEAARKHKHQQQQRYLLHMQQQQQLLQQQASARPGQEEAGRPSVDAARPAAVAPSPSRQGGYKLPGLPQQPGSSKSQGSPGKMDSPSSSGGGRPDSARFSQASTMSLDTIGAWGDLMC